MRMTRIFSIAVFGGMVVLAASGGLTGCGSSCEPDELKFCPCLGGSTGAQRCSEEGDYWSVCSCGSEQNDTLAMALTGQPSHQQTLEPRIVIQGVTPEGRGTQGLIQILNHLSPPSQPMTISFPIVNGAYAEEVPLVTGTNQVSVLILEQEEPLAEVDIVVDLMDPQGDTEHIWDPYADTDTQGHYDEVQGVDTDTDTAYSGIVTPPLNGGDGLAVTVWEIGTDTVSSPDTSSMGE